VSRLTINASQPNGLFGPVGSFKARGSKFDAVQRSRAASNVLIKKT
jgi:hypothetical protein